MAIANDQYLWGIDLGGTKIEIAVMEGLNTQKVLLRERIPTESQLGYEHILQNIKKLVIASTRTLGFGPTSVGIGTPGSFDPYTASMKNCNTTCLNGKKLHEDLEALLGTPVTVANDANCFALAETQLGVVRQEIPEAEVVFGIIMGTGVGGGVVIKGEILNGMHGIGGEWGHNFLDESGGACYCGKTGCTETVISGPALEKFYFQSSGRSLKLKEIVQLAQEEKDPYAMATIDRLIEGFGKALSNIVNVLDPDAIVLGGGLGNIDLLYTEGRKAVLKHTFNPYFNTPLLKPLLGDSAGVFGAAALNHEV